MSADRRILVVILVATSLAGCAQVPAATPLAADPDPLDPSAALLQAIAVSGSGHSETFLCFALYCGGRDNQNVDIPQEPSRRYLHGNLTWNAGPTGTPVMRAYLLIIDVDGGWSWDEEQDPSADGASPLQISWDISRYEGQKLVLHLASESRAAGVWYGVGEPWHFEGELLVSRANASEDAAPAS